MPRSSAIARLLAGMQGPPHDYNKSTAIFPNLNVDKLAADLRLQDKGASRGKADEPPSASETLDDVEYLVIERIEGEKRAAHGSYNDQLQTYAERMTALDFEGRFTDIRQAAPQAVGDFRAEAAQGRNELFRLRRRIIETERDREIFRKHHNLQRSARVSRAGKQLLKIGLLLVIAVFEIAVNGAFLAKGNEQGLLGGAVQAVSFALLNVLASFLIGLSVVRLLNHRYMGLKVLGLFGVMFYLSFSIGLNLSLAHYREVAGLMFVDTGIEVVQRLRSSPLGLVDITSWIFFGVGLTFSTIAMADGIVFRDPYPGYEAVEKACIASHHDYTETVSDLINNLRDIRDEASEAMAEAGRDLSLKRGEFDSILQARARLNIGFADFQVQLERTSQALLSIYREANRRARSSPTPAHFGQPYRMEPIPPVLDTTSGTARDELRKSISKSQELLAKHIEAVNEQFDAAVASYREIDKMLPEAADGTFVKAA